MPLAYAPFVRNSRIQQAARNNPAMRPGEVDQRAVSILQQALLDLGVPLPLSTNQGRQPPDGRYGDETSTAVYGFQFRHQLGRDGIAGREVIERLDELLSSSKPGPQPAPTPPEPTPVEPGKRRLLPELLPQVNWEVWTQYNFQLLASPASANLKWDLEFGGGCERGIYTSAFTCAPELKTPHLGIAVPAGTPSDLAAMALPDAYLLYLHHSTDADYRGTDFFLKGIGDVLIGRQGVALQLSQSGKNVAVLVPEPRGQDLGIFNTNPKLLLAALQEVDETLTGVKRELPPLLLACYSDGIGQMIKFEQFCSSLLPRVKAVYDLDGAYVVRFRNYNFGGFVRAGAKVFRYVGLPGGRLNSRETDEAYLNRLASQQPGVIALPKGRWSKHPLFKSWVHPYGDGEWLHYLIPTCMLAHGLMATEL